MLTLIACEGAEEAERILGVSDIAATAAIKLESRSTRTCRLSDRIAMTDATPIVAGSRDRSEDADRC